MFMQQPLSHTTKTRSTIPIWYSAPCVGFHGGGEGNLQKPILDEMKHNMGLLDGIAANNDRKMRNEQAIPIYSFQL